MHVASGSCVGRVGAALFGVVKRQMSGCEFGVYMWLWLCVGGLEYSETFVGLLAIRISGPYCIFLGFFCVTCRVEHSTGHLNQGFQMFGEFSAGRGQ